LENAVAKEQLAPDSMPAEIAMRRALVTRDAAFDGAFVYGVITTGVYCRPCCASRPANASNVRFFPDPDAAERAGLRSCKRCKPREVAKGIGAPKAVRAAASACAANRIAVLVPCHRVLRGDGALGGYRWGLDRKRALIDAERARRAS
jgi:O-6-methylguanine DNA methyltransferase